MATLLLTSAATALTSSLGSGALATALVTTAATVGGRLIDQALFGGGRDQTQEGPRLDDLRVTSSNSGAAVTRFYGRVRISGEVIWATNFEEVASTTSTGGKGGSGATTTEYTYFANFAIGLGEGPIGFLSRIWADGNELDLSSLTYRLYLGTEDQQADSLIESIEGTDNAPAYRGLAYVVFERLELTDYGNRIPQLTFEVTRPSPFSTVEPLVKGVNLIPGSTEFGYEPDVIEQITTSTNGTTTGSTVENTHQTEGVSDWTVSLNQLASTLPSVQTVCLVVSWFFDDLRCGEAQIRPHVESATKQTTPNDWLVSNVTRDQAVVVSYVGDSDDLRPAFGGAPDDASVIHAIQDLKARGYRVMLYPFLMGDINAGNGLADPYGSDEQAAFPWRGRITCFPAPGTAGSPDQTSVVDAQVASFLGAAQGADFSIVGETIVYSGDANDWGYRRFILHMASLASAAGGVDSFCIGSEMVAMSTLRSSRTDYPFVTALTALAGDVRQLLGLSTKIGYAADWSEYHSHRPSDGTGDVIFHLDPLWSNSDIDFIGIDNYLPIADWRDGRDHLDFQPSLGHTTCYDLSYLKANIEGGEYYDWYYAGELDRVEQNRTLIEDLAYGEDWVYRQKDIRNWWKCAHYNRIGGVREGVPTNWTASSKPIWFTEIGCPAVDKGSNQPNVFFDPKSSESFLPYFSSGNRDDVVQRRFIQAHLEYWRDNNEVSQTTGVTFVDTSEINIWSWDARPFPTWPLDAASWGDQPNWQFGHWLNTRVGSVYAPDLMAHMASDYGFTAGDFEYAYGSCDGYIIDSSMSLRDAFAPLSSAFFFDLVETGDEIKAVSRHAAPVAVVLDDASLVRAQNADDGKDLVVLTRGQETELPQRMRLTFLDAERAYQSTTIEAVRDGCSSTSTAETSLSMVLDEARGQSIAERWLIDVWAGREVANFDVVPALIALEVGDIVTVPIGDYDLDLRVTDITDGESRRVTAGAFSDTQLASRASVSSDRALQSAASNVFPLVRFLDLPLLQDSDDEQAGYLAIAAQNWPGEMIVYRSYTTDNWQFEVSVNLSAIMGELLTDLTEGPKHIFDNGTVVEIEIFSGELGSVDELSLLNGDNAFAVQKPSGSWEIFQAQHIELIGQRTYRLSKLLRGSKGSEHAVSETALAGATIVKLDDTLRQSTTTQDDINVPYYYHVGPTGKALGSASFVTSAHAYQGEALKPLAPCHVALDAIDNDFMITWVRRGRVNADSWALSEIPLGEEYEAYEVDILVDGAVRRTLSSTSESVLYTYIDQVSDGALAGFTAHVYQLSNSVGRGYAAPLVS